MKDDFFIDAGAEEIRAGEGAEEMEESDQSERGFEIKVEEGEGEEDGAGAKTDTSGNYFG